MNSGWRKKTYALSWLRKQAHDYREMNSVLPWLQRIGVVPADPGVIPGLKSIRTDAEPDGLDAWYLALSAKEWDSWGESSPVDFVEALSLEMKGNNPARDVIAALIALAAMDEAEAQEALAA